MVSTVCYSATVIPITNPTRTTYAYRKTKSKISTSVLHKYVLPFPRWLEVKVVHGCKGTVEKVAKK